MSTLKTAKLSLVALCSLFISITQAQEPYS